MIQTAGKCVVKELEFLPTIQVSSLHGLLDDIEGHPCLLHPTLDILGNRVRSGQ